MIKKILFRADGNTDIGMGHVIRSLALADMLKDKFECVFATRYVNEYIIAEIEKSCSSYIKLSEKDNEHFEEFLTYIKEEDTVVLDNYFITTEYQKQIKGKGCKLICIDDMHNKHYVADVVINHAPGLRENKFSVEPYTRFALGPKYAMLRPKFIEASKKSKTIDKISNIFVSFGGADFYDLTNKCIKGIINLENIQKINVVIGSAYKHSEIYSTIKGFEDKVVIHKKLSESQMMTLMNECQLGIVPSSTISYEVCSVKMVVLGGYYVDNQEVIYKGLAFNGLLYSGGDFYKLNADDFKRKVLNIIKDNPVNYKKIITNQSKMFDGKQKERFNKLIESIC